MYHGRLNFESATEDLIDGADVLPYPNAVPPISISLTEFHFVLLYKDRVVALSTLDQKLSYEEVLPLVSPDRLLPRGYDSFKRSYQQKPNEQVRGMTADPLGKMGKTYWVYTDQAIYELGAKNEDRDVWKTYLDKQQYDLSLKYARVRIRDWLIVSSFTLTFYRLQHSEILCSLPRHSRSSTKAGISRLRKLTRNVRFPLKRSL